MAPKGDLSVTALYTSHTWSWAKLSCAELLDSDDAARVFGATNAFLWLARVFRRLPSLPHSLAQRHVLIDRVLEREQPTQVLELASGLSRRGAALSAQPTLRYVELDLPQVVARKRALLARTDAGRAVLARPNLTLVEADAERADLAALVATSATPTRLAVVAEGLFMYLQPEAQRRLWAKIRAVFDARGGGLADTREPPSGSAPLAQPVRPPIPRVPGLFIFDLVPVPEQPPPGLIGRALGWLMRRFTGGQTFTRDARTRADLVAELMAAGFGTVEPLDPRAIGAAYALPFTDVPTQQLVFVCRP